MTGVWDRLRRLGRDVAADLRTRDVPLAAAGLTFYALLSLVPLVLLSTWLASLVLGDAHVRRLGGDVGRLVGSGHDLAGGVHALAEAGTSPRVSALLAAALVAALYGEGFTRALARLSDSARRRRTHVVRGRVLAALLILATGVLVTGGLLITGWLSGVLGQSGRATVLGVYLAFLVCWAGATANVLLCYRVFAPVVPRLRALLWGAAGAGSWIAGSALGFLVVLRTVHDLGRPFAGSDALGTAALLAFWLYLSHIAVLLGYATALRLGSGPRDQAKFALRGYATAGSSMTLTQ